MSPAAFRAIRVRLEEIRVQLDAALDPPASLRAAILERRARAVAAARAVAPVAAGTPVVVCRLGDERPAFVLAEVRRIARGVTPARVPGAAAPWRHVVLLDSVLVQAVDLGELLGAPRATAAGPRWCVALDAGAVSCAVLLDEVLETASIDDSRLLPGRHPLVRGVSLDGVMLIDTAALVRPSQRAPRG